jgi:hypothetical protein
MPPTFALLSCLAYSILKMVMICSSETSVNFQRTTRRYIPEDRNFHYFVCYSSRGLFISKISSGLFQVLRHLYAYISRILYDLKFLQRLYATKSAQAIRHISK